MLLCNASFCSDFLNNDIKGWFWGEEPIEEVIDKNQSNSQKVVPQIKPNTIKYKNKKYKIISKKVDIPFKLLDQLDPDEINKMEVESRKISMMYPTKDNITQYKFLQYYIAQKAKGFASSSSDVMRQNPQLANWVASIPTGYIAKKTETRIRNKKQLNIMKAFKEKVIILIATEPNCPYCTREIPLLEIFTQKNLIEYKEVNIKLNIEFAQKYGVERTPTMFLLYNDNGNPRITRIATGLQTLDDIQKAVLVGLYTFKLIPKDYL
jgi:thiol-disulfide isomerase/thioredoxin